MNDVVIAVRGLGKKYRIGKRERYHSLSDTFARVLSAPYNWIHSPRREASLAETFWALKDVSFEVRRGEVVGVIGRNGAGKSTLLKVLSRITGPTTGEVRLYGRVGSLLEVGTGFHPELTGRENVYLNGTILGMKRTEIVRKFDEIIAFAEVEKFLDTPVKHYSSGMYLRLAFAVAAHLDPEILIVDEVLAVGDTAFQKKCLGKMDEVAKGGRTVLFVSHSMEAVSALCGRCLLLSEGGVSFEGETQLAVSEYMRLVAPSGIHIRENSGRIMWIGLENAENLQGLSSASDVTVRMRFKAGGCPLQKCSVDIALDNIRGERVLHGIARFVSDPARVNAGESFVVEYRFLSPRLSSGEYTLTIYAEDNGQVEFWAERIPCLSVAPIPDFGNGLVLDGFTGAVTPVYQVRFCEPAGTAFSQFTGN